MVVDGSKLDGLMAGAWPPAVSEARDGWLLRFTSGVTRRANSVLVAGEPSDLGGAISAAEAFYRDREVPPVFLVSDASAPESVKAALESRGYKPTAQTRIFHGDAATIAGAEPLGEHFEVEVTEEPTTAWLDAYWSVESGRHQSSDRAIVRDVLLKPQASARFVSVRNGSGVVSVGQVVIDRGWGCCQCLATLPAGRRRGAGMLVMQTLAREVLEAGAPKVFGAVMADNSASRGLMGRLGMSEAHQYCYYVR